DRIEKIQNTEKKCYTLPIGPQHPMYVESENMQVHVDGETIVGVDINVGYMHRGIEELMQRRNYIQNIYLAERICGICMPGNHEIILKDGSIIKLSDFIDKKIPGKPNPISSVSAVGDSTISWNGSHVKHKNITHVQKIKAPDKLFRIKTASGNELLFTGDHPIMVDTERGNEMILSKHVRPGDRVYSPRKIHIEGKVLRIIDCLPDNFKIVLNRKFFEKISSNINKEHRNKEKFSKKTGLNHWRLQRMRTELRVHEFKKLCNHLNMNWEDASENIEELSTHGITLKLREKYVTEEMMNILGLLASDGYFGNMRNKGKNFNHRITFVNKEKALIKKVENLHKKMFPDKKIDKFIMGSTVPAIRVSNPILTFVAQRLGLNALKNRKNDIKEIFKLPEKHIAAFLRGYFDGDGTCRNYEIIYYTSDVLMAKRLRLLLKRVGIASSLSVSESKGFKKGQRWSISITNKEDQLKFIEEIGSNHPKKVKILSKMKKPERKETFTSIFQLAPKKSGFLLRKLRKKYNISPKDIGAVSDLRQIERGKKNVMKWRMKKYLAKMEEFVDKNEKDFKDLNEMLSNRFYVDPIKEVEEINNIYEHVYDLTIKDTHNFIPEGGFVVGNCSGIHSVTYCQTIENLLSIKPPERAEYIRTVILELERLHSHFLFLGVMGYEMGLDTAFMYAWKDREIVMNMLESISGNRVNYGMPTIGGSRRDIPDKMIPALIKSCDKLRDKGKYYVGLFKHDTMLQRRVKRIGYLKRRDVNRFSLIGPVARASGLNYDIRKAMPYSIYDRLKWNVITNDECDVRARILVKALEIEQSVKILNQCFTHLRDMKKNRRVLRTKVPLTVPPAEGYSISEAPRGELLYYARSNGTDIPARMRIRTPSFINLVEGLPLVLKGAQLADLPVIVASFDPCFSCCDRVAVVDEKSGNKQVFNETELRRYLER
ncbi:MAG: hypothetical protein KKG13_00740, partial [Nanoarchaeota archaeon]|nr:hypothetical protein [Nanoarchaeota archaeon]